MSEGRDKVLERVRKLMQLGDRSKNPSRAEAESALRRAAELMAKWNIESHEVEGPAPGDYCLEVVVNRAGRVPEERWIASILDQFFFVKVIVEDRKGRHRLMLYGTEVNVLAAELVWHLLLRTFRDLWADHRRGYGVGRRAQRPFYVGLAEGLSNRLRRERAAARPSDGFALVRVAEDLALRLREDLGPIKERCSRPIEVNGEDAITFMLGERAGRKIALRRGVGRGPVAARAVVQAPLF